MNNHGQLFKFYAHYALDQSKQQIRLLEVRRSATARIERHVEVFNMHDCPEYTALHVLLLIIAPHKSHAFAWVS